MKLFLAFSQTISKTSRLITLGIALVWGLALFAKDDAPEPKDTIRAIFSIIQLEPIDSNTYKVTINAGKDLGVTRQPCIVLTKYDANDLERDNQLIGDIEIKQIEKDECTGIFTFKPGMQKYGLKQNDLTYVNLSVPRDMHKGILLEMAKIGLFLRGSTQPFSSEDLKPLYTWQTIFSLRSKQEELAVISTLRAVALNTREMFRGSEEEYEMFKPTYEGGKFDGQKILDMLENTTEIDILMYLEFVSEYPYKYMGVDFRFDETYATWAINKTPLTEKTDKILQDYLAHLIVQDKLQYNQEDVKYYLANIVSEPSTWIDGLNLPDSIAMYKTLATYLINQGSTSFNTALQLKIGNIYQTHSEYTNAINYYSKVIGEEIESQITQNFDVINAYWYRANCFSELEKYTEAIADYDSVIVRYPFASVFGSKGWLLLKTGKWRDAKMPIHTAYDLDSQTFAWTLNLGHSKLFSNESDSASYFYNLAINNATTLEEVTLGIEDFDIFISNGWFEKECKNWKSYFQSKLQDDSTKHSILYKEYFNKFLEEENSLRKLSLIDSAIQNLQLLPNIDYKKLRLYTRWKAYTLFDTGSNKESYELYLAALNINKEHINEEELLLDDYTDLATLARMLNEQELASLYGELQANLERKIGLNSKSKALFIFEATSKNNTNIGIKSLTDSLLSDNNTIYANKSIARNEKQNALASLRKYIEKSKSSDDLLFCFSGATYNNDGKKGFIIGEDSISKDSLIATLLFAPMQNKIILLDADDIGFIEDFITYRNQLFSETDLANIEIITTHPLRHVLASEDNTIMGFALSEAAKNLKTLTTQNLKQELETQLESNALFFNLSSYSSGNSIVLYKKTMDTKVPKNSATRGIEVDVIHEENKATTSSEKSIAIVIGVSEYAHWNNLKNPKNDATSMHQILTTKYDYNSKLMLDPTVAEIEAMLRSIRHTNAESVVVFFAGHGYFEDETQQGYIVGRDSKLPQDDPNMSTYYSHNRLIAMLENLDATDNVLLIIDACFSGTIESESKTMGEGHCAQADGRGLNKDAYADINDNQFILQNLNCPTFKYITSGGKEYVPDGTKEHSPFAAKLLESLEINGGIASDQILTYSEIRTHLQRVNPQPRYGRFGKDFSSSEFLFVKKK